MAETIFQGRGYLEKRAFRKRSDLLSGPGLLKNG